MSSTRVQTQFHSTTDPRALDRLPSRALPEAPEGNAAECWDSDGLEKSAPASEAGVSRPWARVRGTRFVRDGTTSVVDSHVNPNTLVLPAQKASGVLAWAGKRGGERERWGGVGWGAGPLRSQELGAGGGARGSVTASRRQSFPYSAPPPPAGILSGKGKGAGSRGVPLTAAEEADRLTDS